MRITKRPHGGSERYWSRRWSSTPVDSGELNLTKYPGLYAEEVANRSSGPILEAGCGMGRVLIYYHDRGVEIVGIDFIQEAVDKIKELRPDVGVTQADITELKIDSGEFGGVMAFGLYHNLPPEAVENALSETFRVMKPGALLAVSMRSDNLQNRINDWIEMRKPSGGGELAFHKANYTEAEFRSMLLSAGFKIERIENVENMPVLYKFRFFRNADQKVFNEKKGRAEGYKLSPLGRILHRTLILFFPKSFCNLMLAIALRPT